MSGFVALFQRNGAPVDRSLLNAMTSFLVFRGPDARETWSSGHIGMGHTLLRTTPASRNEKQPASLDGRFSITADVRLDCRMELREQIVSSGQRVNPLASDAELILHAYAAWKEDCLQRLRGDFSFAIWDAPERRLFCARDHFGVKPFYYSEVRDFFLCSNTLDCVRQHPEVSDELNDDAIADFLLFGLNCNRATTTFQSIQRIPPAHCLTVSADHVRLRRYWSVPVDGRIRYRRQEEYVEHFREKLRAAVAERLDVDRAAIFLSGGMDSGAVAATACEVAAASTQKTELRAYTVTYEKLLGDREGFYAKETADFLGIPIRLLPMDHIRPFELPREAESEWPEPVDDPLLAGLYEQFGAVAEHSRVVLDGEGVDNLMHFQLAPYARDLLQRGEWITLGAAIVGYAWQKRSRLHRLVSRAKRRLNPKHRETVPLWMWADFAARMNVEERLASYGLPTVSPVHPTLPDAHASFELPQWTRMFESGDPGFTREPVEVRYPFLDLRVVEFVLALPVYPLLLDKKLERQAMAGMLPEAILARPKSPLVGDPGQEAMREFKWTALDDCLWKGEIAQYVDRGALSFWRDEPYSAYGSSCIRAVCLNFWLQSSRRVRYNLLTEVSNG